MRTCSGPDCTTDARYRVSNEETLFGYYCIECALGMIKAGPLSGFSLHMVPATDEELGDVDQN